MARSFFWWALSVPFFTNALPTKAIHRTMSSRSNGGDAALDENTTVSSNNTRDTTSATVGHTLSMASKASSKLCNPVPSCLATSSHAFDIAKRWLAKNLGIGCLNTVGKSPRCARSHKCFSVLSGPLRIAASN